METRKQKKVDDKRISMAIMSSFVILTIQYLALLALNLSGTRLGTMVQLTSKLLVGLFYLIALPAVLRRNKIKFVGVYFIAIYIFVLHYTFFSQAASYLKGIIFQLFFMGVPSFIYAYSIDDWEVLMKIIKKSAKIVLLVGTFISVLVFSGLSSVGTYSMSLSYYMLLPATVFMNEFFDDFSLENSIALGVSLIIILLLGSRGAVLCIMVYTLLKFLKNLSYKKMPLYAILFAIGSIGIVFSNRIFLLAYNFLLNFGIDSRSLRKFAEGGVDLSSRAPFYEKIFDAIMENPIFGMGLMGDRVVLDGRYVHNIFMEILVNFGIIMGVALIILLLYAVIKSLFVRDITKYNVIIIWLSLGFVHLMISNTYIVEFKFWVFLGLVTNILLKPNKDKEKEYDDYHLKTSVNIK